MCSRTELWERISFNAMQALLVLYMVGQVLLRALEHVAGIGRFAHSRTPYRAAFGKSLALQVFGLYIGLFRSRRCSRLLGDRVLGVASQWRGRAADDCRSLLHGIRTIVLLALLLLILGAGFLRGNLASQMGQLYRGRPSGALRHSSSITL